MARLLEEYSPYPKYKECSIHGLSVIPSDWNELPLFSICKIQSVVNQTDKELLSVYLRQGVIKFSDVKEKRTNVTSLDLSKYQLVKVGNFVLNNQQAWRGSVGVSVHEGIVSPAYLVLELSKVVDPLFANYLFRDSVMVGQYLASSKGVGTIQRNLYWPQLKRKRAALPPVEDQKAISHFLNDKTEKIERAIAIKEKQIELLKERKQILIQNAVTRGLNPDVPMKDSCVDWIGEIPAHWKVKRLQFLSDIRTGERNTEDKISDGKFPFYVRSQVAESINSYSYDGEAILTAGDGAGVGKVYHYVNGKFDFHQRVYCFSNFRAVSGPFLFYYLRALFYNVAILGTAKSTVDSLRRPLIQNFLVAHPTCVKEQSEITEFIKEKSNSIDTLIERNDMQIKNLKEYKASLINSAVTGKIKVSA